MKKYKVGIFILCGLLSFVTGCIKEDKDNCFPEHSYNLSFIYYGDGTTDIFSSRTENVYVYFFDMEGEYVDRYIRTKSQLDTYQGIAPDLPPGQYTVVCWSNISEWSEFTGEGASLPEEFLYNGFYLNEETIINFDSLYYGSRHITIPEYTEKTDTIYFESAHIKMGVYIQGLSETIESGVRAIGDSQGWISVRNISVGYDFEMRLMEETSDMYPTLTDVDNSEENMLSAKFNLLRFGNTNPIVIEIFNGNGRQVYSLNLQEFMSNNNINVEGRNEVTIPIYIRFIDNIYVHVSVSEWETGIVEPIFRQ